MTSLFVRLKAATVVFGVVVAGAAVPSPASGTHHGGGYSALIRRASYGVPHITADDFGSLGFGVGYVQAEDNICVIAESVVTANGERSRWFGAAGPDDPNVRSDLFYRKAIDDRVAERLLEGRRDGVRAPSDDVRDQIRGFVAGYNHFLRRTGVQRLSDPACRGKAWVRPLSEIDFWRTSWDSMVRAGSRALLDGIVTATPPTAAGPARASTVPDAAAVVAALDGASAGIGSNAYGLGAQATTNGSGMVLANPHFPWQGAERFYRMHLKVPGRYDVEGAALIGDPLIEIGHNGTLAWSHTVSTARRFVWHRLSLVPGDPASYYVDGRPERMRTRTVTVSTGSGPVSRTFHDTRYGPVVVVPGTFDWTPTTAYAITDVNAGNNRAFDGWLRMGQAKDVRALKAVLDRHQFLPWVNVIAADARGEALYGDHSVVPRVTDALAAACIPAPYQPLYASSGQAVLDGSRSDCALGADPDAAVPGILGPANLPVRFRDDYVTNSNDSHWLASPAAPLEGFARILGSERTQRSLRTRLGLDQIQQRLAGTDGLPGTGFTTARLWNVTFGNRVHGAELVRDDLVTLCRQQPTATASNGATVDLTAACEALSGFDERVDLNSRGAHLFSEFALAGGIRFADTFDVTDPVRTPRRLNTTDPRVRTALADAVQRLAGIPLDAKLGDIHTDSRGEQRIPIHGGRGEAGAFNVITNPLVPGVGYPQVVHGTSFVMAVELGRHGPSGRQILTYAQSTDPNSPWYADQTRLYSRKGWDTIKYTEAQIKADPNLHTYRVTQRRG
ncbi:N-acyl homoserine lactone acylase QqaR [Actinoplanes sichuanensis]|uniref:Acylase n=1 Tax=Actinoplanes sichuanensis TaxID=512349 RepID=A0ABW4A3W7_9ACTN|nr:acylase [Actinoplanes sichuanensis]BEL05884.1 N-acyl homoserine lactone acylase QqaR [Actinoplanes sichuanensis]